MRSLNSEWRLKGPPGIRNQGKLLYALNVLSPKKKKIDKPNKHNKQKASLGWRKKGISSLTITFFLLTKSLTDSRLAQTY